MLIAAQIGVRRQVLVYHFKFANDWQHEWPAFHRPTLILRRNPIAISRMEGLFGKIRDVLRHTPKIFNIYYVTGSINVEKNKCYQMGILFGKQ